MSGSKAGGLKAAKTNKLKYGQNFYRIIGALGGKLGHTGGFYQHRELASRVGAIGGHRSKRRPVLTPEQRRENRNAIQRKYYWRKHEYQAEDN